MKNQDLKICKEHEFKFQKEFYPNGCPFCISRKMAEEMSGGRARLRREKNEKIL